MKDYNDTLPQVISLEDVVVHVTETFGLWKGNVFIISSFCQIL